VANSRFEKTKPICRGLKMMQTQYLQRYTKFCCSVRARKTKPIKAKFRSFAGESKQSEWVWNDVLKTSFSECGFEKTKPICGGGK